MSEPDIWKFHRLCGLLDQTWKFDWISSGRSTTADAKPAPYLIRAVPVEFYTSRIGIFPLIDVLSISWLNLTVPNEFSLHFHLLENSKFLSQNEIFIKTIGFIDSHMITITESYFLTKITLQIFKFCQPLKVLSTVMRHSLHIMNELYLIFCRYLLILLNFLVSFFPFHVMQSSTLRLLLMWS